MPTKINAIRLFTLSTSAGLVGSMLVMSGCQRYEPTMNAVLAPEPPENATFVGTTQPVRDWDQSVALIQNGDTTAGSSGLRYRSSDKVPSYAVGVVEVGVFAANVVTMPYTLWVERGTQVSTGLQFPPTHTAMPALPPEPVTPSADVEMPVEPTTVPTDLMDLTPATVPTDVLESTVTKPEAPSFQIGGQVLKPGTFDASGERKLSDVIAAAEPASEDPAKVRITITRAGEEAATTTLVDLKNGTVEDIVIKAGDVITISIDP